MTNLNQIKQPVKKELEQFDREFKSVLKTPVPLMNLILRYVTRRKGKRIRPLITFLTAGLTGNINEATVTAAVMIELLHTATLVHDDVVDEAEKRRGIFTVNALWKNKAAVLIGDFLLSRGLLVSLEKERFDLLKIVAQATREMSEGELLQMEKARKLDITEEVYFEIIRKKTASLIASCCAAGAASAGADRQTIDKMWTFGEYAGIAFQIKDDLFDYQLINKTGKPSAEDIKERKLTLPLIYLLNRSSWTEKQKYLYTIRFNSGNKQKIKKLFQTIEASGGLQYAEEQMKAYHSKALEILEDFPGGQYKKALEDLLDYIIRREK